MSLASPLSEIFGATGARSVKGADVCDVATAADAEVLAASSRAVLADISDLGHFKLGGRDGVKFLQGLVTNDVAALTPGTGCHVAFLNVHGRFEAVASVFAFDELHLLQTPSEASAWVETFLARYRHAGDFQFERMSDCAAITIQGPLAGEVLSDALGYAVGEAGSMSCVTGMFDGEPVRILRTRRSIAGGLDVVGPVSLIERLVKILLELPGDRLVMAGAGALEVLRVEAGIAAYQKDYDSDTVLQEIDQPDIVSFHKGCYLGQEIVARIHFQGQPSKLLRRIELAGEVVPMRGDELVGDQDEKSAGHVTSVAISPTFGLIVFAMVKRRHYGPGTRVRVRHGDALIDATVVERVGSPATTELV